MTRIAFFVLLLGFIGSCTKIPDPIPKSPDQVETDSLMSVYGKSIVTLNLNYLKYFQLDKSGNTLLVGGTKNKFWLGAFKPDQSFIKENLIQLDPENRFTHPKSNSPAFSQRVLDKLIFQVTTEQIGNTSITTKAISILGLSEYTHDLYQATTYITKDEVIYLETARPWKGGYLLEMNGSLGRSGKNFTQYITTDFSSTIIWDSISPVSPRIGVNYFEVDFFLDILENGVSGFDYSACKQWAYNTLDFFGKATCLGCTTSIKLKNQIGKEITLEVSLNDEVRRIVLEYGSGKIVSNGKFNL